MTESRIGIRILRLLLAGLVAVSAIDMARAQSPKPRTKPLTLEQKAKLPYVFIGEFESLGARSALAIAPQLNLKRLADEGYYVVVRVVRPLVAPAEKPLPQRLILGIYKNWFHPWEHPQNINLPVMQDLFREHYAGRQYIFFGSVLSILDGVQDANTLQLLNNRDYMIHESIEMLDEVQRIIDAKQ